MLQKVPLGRKDTVRLPHVQAQIKRGGALDADAMDSDVKPPAGMLDDLHFSDGAPHAEGSAAAAAAAAIASAGCDTPGSAAGADVDMEDRSSAPGAGDVASSGPVGAVMANTAHRLEVVTEHIRKLLTDQGLPTDAVMCVPPCCPASTACRQIPKR